MKLVMTLLVQDEEDILRDNLLFHFDRGVDFVIATDNNSRDGTRDILEEFRRAGHVLVIDEPGDDYSQWKWVTRMARLAATDHGAAWVINNDADEFWWPDSGDLKTELAAVPRRFGHVTVPRYNFVPLSWEEQGTPRQLVVRRAKPVNAAGGPVMSKVCHRADPNVTVAQGNHSLLQGSPRRYRRQVTIDVLHFPHRGYAQFEHKVVRGGQAYARNRELPATAGEHWRAQYRLFEAGTLRNYFDDELCFDSAAVAAGLAEGLLTIDRRLADALSRIDDRHPSDL